MNRFIQGWLTAVIVVPFATAAANLAVDPFGVFGSPEIFSRPWLRPALLTRERIYKAAMADETWDGVILGTSRAQVGLDPANPAFRGARVMNLATSSQPYRETFELFAQVSRQRPPRIALVGLDFFPADDARPYPADFFPDGDGRPGKLELLFSASTIVDSAATVLGQDLGAARRGGWLIRRDGHRVLGDEYVAAHGGHRALAQMSELRFLSEDYPPPERFVLGASSRHSELNCLRRLVRLAHAADVRLFLFISPAHARQWETLAQAGLWPLWEQWKTALVDLNEREAARAARNPFPLVDFSGYHRYAAEPVPSAGDRATRMTWFIDSSHYRPALGDIVINQLLHPAEDVRSAHFGVRLDGRSLALHLARLAAAREAWRRQYPDEVADIATRLRQAATIRGSRPAAPAPRTADHGCGA
jgi:hypothetical protein